MLTGSNLHARDGWQCNFDTTIIVKQNIIIIMIMVLSAALKTIINLSTYAPNYCKIHHDKKQLLLLMIIIIIIVRENIKVIGKTCWLSILTSSTHHKSV